MNMAMLSAMQRSLLKKVKTWEIKQNKSIFTIRELMMLFLCYIVAGVQKKDGMESNFSPFFHI